MQSNQKKISNLFVLSLIIIVCLGVIIFEAAQQYFYIQRYQLSIEISFLDLFYSQTRKWLIWMFFAIPLWRYIQWLVNQGELNKTLIIRTIGIILALLVSVIITMALIEIILTQATVTTLKVWQEFIVFFTFQKLPIYSFGYTLLALIFYLYGVNSQLTIQLLKLSDLKPKDLNSYYQSKEPNDQNTDVLKIKVGNTYKIVSVDDIDWIEADDYCVNIHNKSTDAIYSMRATLKSLETILPNSFLRVHRSAIVNMDGVEEYKTQGSGLIRLKSGSEITVAQSKLKSVNHFFNQKTG